MTDPLSTEARLRRVRRARMVVPLVIGVPLLAGLVVLTAATGSAVTWLLLGVVVVGAGIALVSGLADRRRREAAAPADPALRANPPLDVDRVRGAQAAGGPAAGVREIRRQAPWLRLDEAVELFRRIG